MTDFGVVRWGNIAKQYSNGIETSPSEILTTWDYLPPETEREPDNYDHLSEAWSFGKTVAEILAWHHNFRVEVLVGKWLLSDSKFLNEKVKSLLEYDREHRISVADSLESFSWYLNFLDNIQGLSLENYEQALSEIDLYFVNLESIKDRDGR